MPGLPLICIGKGDYGAWGVTTNFVDTSDVYSEQLSDDKKKYLLDGEWKDVKYVTEKINIKGKETLDLQVGLTHRGPMI